MILISKTPFLIERWGLVVLIWFCYLDMSKSNDNGKLSWKTLGFKSIVRIRQFWMTDPLVGSNTIKMWGEQ
jgi:hypothetical protein